MSKRVNLNTGFLNKVSYSDPERQRFHSILLKRPDPIKRSASTFVDMFLKLMTFN